MTQNKILPADKSFLVNVDPGLTPIEIPLPTPPKDLTTIDGWDLPIKDQKFTRQEYPTTLKELEEEVVQELSALKASNKAEIVTGQKIIKRIWERLEGNKISYREEIAWIKKQIHYSLYGYWFMCNGKPTYISRFHWFFLNYWSMDCGYGEYRDRDRRKVLAFEYFMLVTHKTWNTPCFGANYQIEDRGRLFFGATYAKHRRDGATHVILAIGYLMTLYSLRKNTVIQSFDEDNAKDHYIEKLIPAWQEMPFFFKAMWDGFDTPKDGLLLKRQKNESFGKQLGSTIKFSKSAKKKAIDGKKLFFYHAEEEGKTIEENIYTRWTCAINCLSQGRGAVKVGYSLHATTTYEMNQGGYVFQQLCEDSKIDTIDPETGTTKSKLVLIFISALDGLEGFIGPYGESIIEDPTPEQAEYIGKSFGSKKHIQQEKRASLSEGTPEGMSKYYELCREFPEYYSDCWNNMSGENGFNKEKIDRALSRIREYKTPKVKKGDFLWYIDGKEYTAFEYLKNGFDKDNREGKVIWNTNTDQGMWTLSHDIPFEQTNKKYQHHGIWYPQNPFKGVCSSDPFKFIAETKKRDNKGSKLSKGGGAIFLEKDPYTDIGHDPSKWNGNRFIGSFLSSCEKDEFCELMLMATVYFGYQQFCESNEACVIEHFIKRMYAGFLKHQWDLTTGKFKERPGYYVGGDGSIKQEIFKLWKSYISFHFDKEEHEDIIMQVKNIEDMSQMKKYDLFAAGGGCLLGSEENKKIGVDRKPTEKQKKKISLGFTGKR